MPDENISVPPTVSVPGLDERVYPIDAAIHATQQIIMNDAEETIHHAREFLEVIVIQADYHILKGKVTESICDFIRKHYCRQQRKNRRKKPASRKCQPKPC
ncbi:hypothetical protein [Weizmannia acidilactici]|uniref:hypothetical protein n=1 Tax=Weizmannia acidilactici TaxID=2607726 RepID=UPI0020A2A530|nr:hypothetical protein [Weizmannia acidilactici]